MANLLLFRLRLFDFTEPSAPSCEVTTSTGEFHYDMEYWTSSVSVPRMFGFRFDHLFLDFPGNIGHNEN